MPPEAQPSLLLGTHTYAAAGDAGRRQEAGLDSLRALARVEPVNVQFRTGAHLVDGVRTLAVLPNDSLTVTGRRGPRKPLVSEILAALASEASAREIPYFGFTNADILFSQRAADLVCDGGRTAYALFREELAPPAGQPSGIQLKGTDAIVIATRWWPSNAFRFRRYILGEAGWDNTCTAILACHADALLENRQGLIRHEAHATAWTGSPFADYTRLLLARDAGYFHLWCTYHDELVRLRTAGAIPADEADLARRVFVWRPSLVQRALQAGRDLKASVRYLVSRSKSADPKSL